MMTASHFKQLLLPLYPRLHRMALRYLGNVEDAEDMVQEVYLKLWSKRDDLPDMHNVESYCLSLTKHMCIDRLRHVEVEEVDAEEALQPIAATDDVADDVERRDDIAHIKQIVNTLPENQQQVVTLRDIHNYTFEEIEQMTGLAPTNIRVLLSRARKTIRERFEKL